MGPAIGFAILAMIGYYVVRMRAAAAAAAPALSGASWAPVSYGGASAPQALSYAAPWDADIASWARSWLPEGLGGGGGADTRDIVARTLWGEARGEGRDGMHAVANVLQNRAADRRWPNDLADVATQPWQFSAWNANDPNRDKLLSVGPSDPAFAAALDIADRALSGRLADITGGATHYHATSIAAPYWANGATATTRIGNHVFYRNVA